MSTFYLLSWRIWRHSFFTFNIPSTLCHVLIHGTKHASLWSVILVILVFQQCRLHCILGFSGLPVTFRFSSFSRPWQSGNTSKWHVRTCSCLKWSSWNWHCLEIAPTCANRQFSIFTIRVWALDRKQLHKKVLLWMQVWLSGWDMLYKVFKWSSKAVYENHSIYQVPVIFPLFCVLINPVSTSKQISFFLLAKRNYQF